MRTFRILSIDGGGMRGIIPLQILKYIEKLSKQPIYQSFDLIAGTSTGGLLACAMTLATKDGLVYKPVYKLHELEEIYMKYGRIIFPNNNKLLRNIGSYFFPQYSKKGLTEVINKYLKEYRINQCAKPILISTYDIRNNYPLIFKSKDIEPSERDDHSRSDKIDPEKNYKLADICFATSAAPTFFPAHYMACQSIDAHGPQYRNLIDGGVIINNPGLLSVLEVIEDKGSKCPLYKKDYTVDYDNIFVLSLGTGKFTENKISQKNGLNWGKLRWCRPIIELMMEGSSQIADNFLNILLEKNYLRIDISLDRKYHNFTDANEIILNELKEKVEADFFRNETWKQKFENFLMTAKMV